MVGRMALEPLNTEFKYRNTILNLVAKWIEKASRMLANMGYFHFPGIICLSAC